MTEIMLMAYDLLDDFIELEEYKRLKQLSKIVESKYINEINDFKKSREIYDDIMQYGGIYHPDFKDAARKLSVSKAILYQKNEVQDLLMLEQKVQNILNQLIDDIKDTVSPYLRTPNELGMTRKGGSHGCK